MIAFLCLNSGTIKYKNMKEISHGSGLSEGKKNKNTTQLKNECTISRK